MKTLNVGARDAAREAGVRAATDVTGFGLLGHLRNMLQGSGCAGRLTASDVPVYDFVRDFAERGFVTGGSRTNLGYVAPSTRFDAGVSELDQMVLADPQTSGGLLLAVAADRAGQLCETLEAGGALASAVIGEVVAGDPGALEVLP
jgi:selenide,water dikinase